MNGLARKSKKNFRRSVSSKLAMTTPYRDDFDAAREKLADLERELHAVKTQTEEISKLKRDEAALAREVADLTSRLDEMAKRRALPRLDGLRIASPCKADWNEMVGDARVRFCGSCQKNVYNLSEMARQEAEAFLREKAGHACVRLYRRVDGTVLTADCPVGLRKRRRLRNVAMVALSGGFLATGAFLSWRLMTRTIGDIAPVTTGRLTATQGLMPMQPATTTPMDPSQSVMGGMAPPNPPPKPIVVNSMETPPHVATMGVPRGHI